MKIGVVSHLYPTQKNPTAGIFVKDELDFLSKYVDLSLISPVPTRYWFEKRYYLAGQTHYAVKRPLTFSFPRYFLQKLYPASMAYTLKKSGKVFFRDCDIIHAHNAFPEGVASVKAFGNRFPVMVTVHGSDINMFAVKPHLRFDILTALNSMKRVICVSNSLAVKLRELDVSTHIEMIPNGVNTDLFSPANRTDACKSLGLDPDRPRLIFVGNFIEVKGVEYLIRAMPVVMKEYPDCELILLGARPGSNDFNKYDKLIGSSNIKKAVKIVMMTPHDNLPSWMNASDLLVLPSIHEGFGLVAAEALACGLPVVATKSGGPEDIVTDGLGMLVPPKNHEALGEGIVNVLDGAGIVSSEMMVKSIKSRFSYDTISQKIVAVYKSIL